MRSNVDVLDPENCNTMAEVRHGVDVTDAALIELLVQRFGYMDAAARIKTDRQSVRDEARKAEVIANAKTAALGADIPVEPIADIWERLVEASIAYELNAWDERNLNLA